jgi:hypothetical protein
VEVAAFLELHLAAAVVRVLQRLLAAEARPAHHLLRATEVGLARPSWRRALEAGLGSYCQPQATVAALARRLQRQLLRAWVVALGPRSQLGQAAGVQERPPAASEGAAEEQGSLVREEAVQGWARPALRAEVGCPTCLHREAVGGERCYPRRVAAVERCC